MNEKLKKVFRVYEIVSVSIISLLIVSALIIWINIGRFTVMAIGAVLDNYNEEVTELISDYFTHTGQTMGFRAVQMTRQDNVPALSFEFTFDTNDLRSVNINSFHNKSSNEIVRELGITPSHIPDEIKSLVQSTKMAVDINIFDENDNLAFKRLIMPNEIADFLN